MYDYCSYNTWQQKAKETVTKWHIQYKT